MSERNAETMYEQLSERLQHILKLYDNQNQCPCCGREVSRFEDTKDSFLIVCLYCEKEFGTWTPDTY